MGILYKILSECCCRMCRVRLVFQLHFRYPNNCSTRKTIELECLPLATYILLVCSIKICWYPMGENIIHVHVLVHEKPMFLISITSVRCSSCIHLDLFFFSYNRFWFWMGKVNKSNDDFIRDVLWSRLCIFHSKNMGFKDPKGVRIFGHRINIRRRFE